MKRELAIELLNSLMGYPPNVSNVACDAFVDAVIAAARADVVKQDAVVAALKDALALVERVMPLLGWKERADAHECCCKLRLAIKPEEKACTPEKSL